ncbi:peptidase S8, partial [Streptomyces sp. NPDC058953]
TPPWPGPRIWGGWTASGRRGPTPAQDAGRIAVDEAIDQPVVAEPVSLSLGVQRWPHHDDTPVARQLTYRNTGTTAITLDLAVAGRTPAGGPAPAGFFTLDAPRLTVPAGGTASVGLTADTRVEGGGDGLYTGSVTATGGGGTVRVPVVVDREVESYDLTLKAVGADGTTATTFAAGLTAFTGTEAGRTREPDLSSGTAKLRVPKGRYLLEGTGREIRDPRDRFHLIVQPELTVDGDTTVTLDARDTRPVAMSVPDPGATPYWMNVTSSLDRDGQRYSRSRLFDQHIEVATAHLGPDAGGGTLRQSFVGSWVKGANGVNGATEYHAAHVVDGARFATGVTRAFTADEFATAEIGLGLSVPGRLAALNIGVVLPGNHFSKFSRARPGPERLTVRLSTGHGARWRLGASQHIPNTMGGIEAAYERDARAYTAGQTYRIDFNTAVHGPLTDDRWGVFRNGNAVLADMPLLADAHGHPGSTVISGARTTLHRGTTLVADVPRSLFWREPVTIPAADGFYTLTTHVTRDPAVSRVASRVDGVWTFRSAQTAQRSRLPLSVVRFGAAVDVDGTAPAGTLQTFPVTVQGPAAGSNLNALAVLASYDGGTTWQWKPVVNGEVTMENPAAGKSVSLRAHVVDKQGNTGSVTIRDAYFGK